MPQLKGKSYKIPYFVNNINYDKTIINEYDGWIICQYDNNSLKVSDGVLATSTDNSATFPTTLNTAVANDVNNAYMFSNGNILLCTEDNKLYLTNMSLDPLVEKTVYEADGVTPYTLHTPSNASFPGRYFFASKQPIRTGDTDMLVFGNYCNVNLGACPVNIYYSTDYGETIKIAYEFGQNLNYKDDGSSNGSSVGTALGDASNTTYFTRHVHSIEYDAANDKWYCVTGDTIWTYTTPDMEEIQWMQGTYTSGTDSWSWTGLDFGAGTPIPQTSRLKGTEMFFYDGYIYWSADATNVTSESTENGVWRAPISTFTNMVTHEKLFSLPNYNDVISTLKLDENTKCIVGSFTPNNVGSNYGLFCAKNYGQGLVDFYYADSSYNLRRLNSVNGDGYFRFDTETGASTLQATTYMIKIGENLFKDI